MMDPLTPLAGKGGLEVLVVVVFVFLIIVVISVACWLRRVGSLKGCPGRKLVSEWLLRGAPLVRRMRRPRQALPSTARYGPVAYCWSR